MPSYRINKSTTTFDLLIFDVIGGDGREANFISHTGLAKATGKHEDRSKISVLDMGPPLHDLGDSGNMQADVVGSATLNDDEVRKIQRFVDIHASEHASFSLICGEELMRAAPQMYCIHPHVDRLYEADGRYARTRFSCSGFVFEAYKNANITLLDLSKLPKVENKVIRSAYGAQIWMANRVGTSLADLGLGDTDEAKPVLLCGYLFHALNREANDIRSQPYTPVIADQYFT